MIEWYQKVHTDGTDYTNDDLEQAIKTAVERYRLDDPARSLLGVAAVSAVVEWMEDNGYMVVGADTELYEWVGSYDSTSEGSPIPALIATKVLRRVGGER